MNYFDLSYLWISKKNPPIFDSFHKYNQYYIIMTLNNTNKNLLTTNKTQSR